MRAPPAHHVKSRARLGRAPASRVSRSSLSDRRALLTSSRSRPRRRRFEVSLANITGVPGKVDRAVLTLARGSKTQTSSASDVADGAAMWRSAELDPDATLAFVATLFKNADGSFEKKEYSVKAQACLHTPGAKTAKLATFAKTVDLAQYATLEPPPEGTFTYLPLDAGASKAKGVIAGINVNVRWLKDAKRGDADAATEDSGMSGRLGGSAVGAAPATSTRRGSPRIPPSRASTSPRRTRRLREEIGHPRPGPARVRGGNRRGGHTHPQQQHDLRSRAARLRSAPRGPARARAARRARGHARRREEFSPESSASSEREAHSAVANSPQHTPAHVVVARAIAPYQAEIEDVRAQLAEAKTALSYAESDAKEFEVKLASARDALRAVVAENERKMSDAAWRTPRSGTTSPRRSRTRAQAAEVANAARRRSRSRTRETPPSSALRRRRSRRCASERRRRRSNSAPPCPRASTRTPPPGRSRRCARRPSRRRRVCARS